MTQSQISVEQTAGAGGTCTFLRDDADIFQLLEIPHTSNKGLLSDVPHMVLEGKAAFFFFSSPLLSPQSWITYKAHHGCPKASPPARSHPEQQLQ